MSVYHCHVIISSISEHSGEKKQTKQDGETKFAQLTETVIAEQTRDEEDKYRPNT